MINAMYVLWLAKRLRMKQRQTVYLKQARVVLIIKPQ